MLLASRSSRSTIRDSTPPCLNAETDYGFLARLSVLLHFLYDALFHLSSHLSPAPAPVPACRIRRVLTHVDFTLSANTSLLGFALFIGRSRRTIFWKCLLACGIATITLRIWGFIHEYVPANVNAAVIICTIAGLGILKAIVLAVVRSISSVSVPLPIGTAVTAFVPAPIEAASGVGTATRAEFRVAALCIRTTERVAIRGVNVAELVLLAIHTIGTAAAECVRDSLLPVWATDCFGAATNLPFDRKWFARRKDDGTEGWFQVALTGIVVPVYCTVPNIPNDDPSLFGAFVSCQVGS